jgi:hypothetical protein
MRGRLVRSLILTVTGLAAGALAEAPLGHETLNCRPEAAPGRVLCELEVEVTRGRLVWADALVVRAPDFARPLRARVGPSNALGATDRRLRLPVALAATRSGRGELEVRARAVACLSAVGGGEVCRPLSHDLTAAVEVGVESR